MKITNRRASHDYEILEKFEAGISLLGPEVKSVREGKMSLDESFVKVKDGQAYLFNAHIHPYRFADTTELDPKRTRKLLLHKKELLSLETKMRQGNLTIVPISCYTKGRNIKLELALAKGKKIYQKKEALKRKDIQREIESELKLRG